MESVNLAQASKDVLKVNVKRTDVQNVQKAILKTVKSVNIVETTLKDVTSAIMRFNALNVQAIFWRLQRKVSANATATHYTCNWTGKVRAPATMDISSQTMDANLARNFSQGVSSATRPTQTHSYHSMMEHT